ncbi:MAG: hypothetical protein VX078_08105, partial [Pseudomonadota bacterium]|nr:hypothetical protein [Pseudomonadota bacterium]
MRLTIIMLLVIPFFANANDEITIHINETGYFINESNKFLTKSDLEIELTKLDFSSVTLDIDYC